MSQTSASSSLIASNDTSGSPLIDYLTVCQVLDVNAYPSLTRGHTLSNKRRLLEIDSQLADYRNAILNVQQNMLALEKERTIISEQLYMEEHQFEESVVRALRASHTFPALEMNDCAAIPSSLPSADCSSFQVPRTQQFYVGFDVTEHQRSGRIQILCVHGGSPSELAGLKTGDIICSIDGFAMLSLNHMRQYFETWALRRQKSSFDMPDSIHCMTLAVLRPVPTREQFTEGIFVLYPVETY